ncbi:hypothetical protein OD806_21925, partial [Aeromonas veronii]
GQILVPCLKNVRDLALDVTKNPRHSNVYSVLNDDALYIAKFIQKDKDGWIVMTYPYYLIQKVKIVGTQSFW